MAEDLESVLALPNVEDIVLSLRGLSWFCRGTWHGPQPSPDSRPDRLLALARRIAESAAVVIGPAQPSVDAYLTLSGGETFRAHVIVPPLAAFGTEITLRRLPKLGSYRLESFCEDAKVVSRLRSAVRSSLSILVAGATGSGKTSLITALMENLPTPCRVLILEDTPELPLPNPLASKLLARTDRFGTRSGATWDLAHLVFESLRMRPDRLILGECRGPEALAIAHALHTGHGGLITSIHAGSAQEARTRFAELVARQGAREAVALSANEAAVSSQLWKVVVHIECAVDGRRRISEVEWA